MNQIDYAITFACYNQVEYTRQCIDSMIKHGVDLNRLVVVDNGSTDDTGHYLKSLRLGGYISNKINLGCGVAWNQGVLARQAEWSIIMNNDVIVSPRWIENMIVSAKKNDFKIISPAMIEGRLDYDFDSFSENASVQMKNVIRSGGHHAVCLAVHHSVWLEIGYFQANPKLLGYEDTIFFHEADKACISSGMTGSAWVHHFGSMTQMLLKKELGLSMNDRLGYRYNYRLLHQSWLERKLKKIKRNWDQKHWCEQELSQFGMSLHGIREKGAFAWK